MLTVWKQHYKINLFSNLNAKANLLGIVSSVLTQDRGEGHACVLYASFSMTRSPRPKKTLNLIPLFHSDPKIVYLAYLFL